MGILYVIATPIGNLKDITLRAIEALQQVDAIACEDTRKTGNLLKTLQINKPDLISYYEQNELRRIPEIVTALKNGLNIALVSDAGTPTISDPGYKLVRECVREKIPVVPIPGASSVLAALTISGLPTDKFLFVGYLPHKSGHRKTFLESLKNMLLLEEKIHPTTILFESPHRLMQLLGELHDALGDINMVICRELTKVYEEVRREKVSESLSHFQKQTPKGEFVVLFNLYGQD